MSRPEPTILRRRIRLLDGWAQQMVLEHLAELDPSAVQTALDARSEVSEAAAALARRHPATSRGTGTCGCECSWGGFCGGCGHRGCGRR